MQYLGTGWIGVLVPVILAFFILFNIFRAEKGKKDLYIRRIAGLNAIDDAVGRATEMGRPILMVPGIGLLDAVAVQAVQIFSQVTKTAAQFSTPIKLCCANAAVYAVAQEMIRDVYQEQGMIDRYSIDSVQYVSDQQFAFAAGVSGIILREKVAATFLLGAFYAESLIFAETSNSIGAIQVAGSTQTSQTPFFIAACDYVLIGDEFYAASAYLTREPVLVGSLVGQDWCKILVTVGILGGTLVNSIDMTSLATQQRVDDPDTAGAEIWQEFEPGATTEDRSKVANGGNSLMNWIFNPMVPAEAIESAKEAREPKPVDDEDAEAGNEEVTL